MEHEIKIVLKYSSNNTLNLPLTNSRIHVYIDGEDIEGIQNIDLSASCQKESPELQITFPDPLQLSKENAASIASSIEALKGIPALTIKVQTFKPSHENIPVKELGSSNYIDIIPSNAKTSNMGK